MCRMLAYFGEPVSLKEFVTSKAYKALIKISMSDFLAPHNNGFGIAVLKDGWNIKFHDKEIPYKVSSHHRFILIKSLKPITDNRWIHIDVKSKMIIVHARKASIGSISIENVHPFLKKTKDSEIVLAHNGTAILNNINYKEGISDTKIILEKLTKLIGNNISSNALIEAFYKITEMVKNGSALNLFVGIAKINNEHAELVATRYLLNYNGKKMQRYYTIWLGHSTEFDGILLITASKKEFIDGIMYDPVKLRDKEAAIISDYKLKILCSRFATTHTRGFYF